jgi:hypothetical protein
MQLHEKWLKYILFRGHQMHFGLSSHIELSLELKLKSKIIKYVLNVKHV